MLFFVGLFSLPGAVNYQGFSDFHCSRVAGTTTCGDDNKTGAELNVLFTGADPNATVTSSALLTTARVAWGLLVLGVVLALVRWVLGMLRRRLARARYERAGRRRGRLP